MTALHASSDVAPSRVMHAPPTPGTIAVTGLELGFLVDLLIKTIYWQGL